MWKKLIEFLKKLFEKKPKPDPEPDPDIYPDAIDPKEITWLGPNISEWEKKYSLYVNVSGDKIIYDQEGTASWPPVNVNGGDPLNGNPWVIAKLNGKWTAATHEWLRPGQKIKGKRTVHGDHIKRGEFGANWTPTSGEEYGFVVSGLARGGASNVSERTQIVLYTWP